VSQIIDICLLYLFVTLTLKLYNKSIFKSLKIAFYVFAFFAKFLVINFSNKSIIRCKIKFYTEVT
jgi:hypothetical protein